MKTTSAMNGKLSDAELVALDEEFIVLAVPADTVEVEITATVFLDGELKTAYKKMGFAEVRSAMNEAEDGYIPSNAIFTLTKTGEDKLEELLRRYMDDIEEYMDDIEEPET